MQTFEQFLNENYDLTIEQYESPDYSDTIGRQAGFSKREIEAEWDEYVKHPVYIG